MKDWATKPLLVNTSSRLCTDFDPLTPSQSNAIHAADDSDVGGFTIQISGRF